MYTELYTVTILLQLEFRKLTINCIRRPALFFHFIFFHLTSSEEGDGIFFLTGKERNRRGIIIFGQREAERRLLFWCWADEHEQEEEEEKKERSLWRRKWDFHPEQLHRFIRSVPIFLERLLFFFRYNKPHCASFL